MYTLTEDFLKVQGTYFRVLGFDIVDGRNGWLHPCRTTVMMTALIVVQPMIVVFVLQNVENLDNLTDGIGSMLVDLLALLKFSIIMWLQCIDEVSASIIRQENQSEQRVSGIYKNSFMLTAILSSLMPIVNTIIFYWQTGNVELQLTFPCA
ncbi:putative odorant receptor 98b [Drosophila sulfurigaster albostrigata]|uniref:putative odorant receptor 98b n=1 Tax=Drosophila sulfurigaster albostrigata TaxID=89887 RepID=UPI002D21D75C|nr:putative odorant receptor 98b [Drosophila sulfurigaster albostrigata]